MEFNKLITTRRSIRGFTDEMIPNEVLKRIFEQTRLSPTWANKQGVKYVLVSDPSKIEIIREASEQEWTKSANVFVVVCIDPKDSGKNHDGLQYFPVDAAICLTQLIYSATNEGLGTVWMGWFKEEPIKKALNIPKETRIIGMTPLGYPKYKPKEQKRKDLQDFVFGDDYGKVWEGLR
ncbi:nitroreductase family protein [Candidatus Lokiarchaeum ossiferum]|uniref:nitroreductase family protein n=1 Tax=Candidatus Lokiarchaeum ossiferum TaxID=2951803 RepID=UPI00352E5560